MTTTETYNGWKNYETWCVNLWLDNNEASQDYVYRLATGQELHYHLSAAHELKEYVHDAFYGLQDEHGGCLGMFSDLIGHALGRVNWEEIIRAHQE